MPFARVFVYLVREPTSALTDGAEPGDIARECDRLPRANKAGDNDSFVVARTLGGQISSYYLIANLCGFARWHLEHLRSTFNNVGIDLEL